MGNSRGALSVCLAITLTWGLMTTEAALAGDGEREDRDRGRIVNCDRGKSIQRALDRARPGATIRVRGTCTEAVTIGKDNQVLSGVDGASITAPDTSTATITAEGRKVVIENLTVSGGNPAISVENGGSAVIRNNHVTRSGRNGIEVVASGYARIEDNIIGGATEADGNAGIGIFVARAASTDIDRNDIQNNVNDGILVNTNGFAMVRDNIISNNGRQGVLVNRGGGVYLGSFVTGGSNTIEKNSRAGLFCSGYSHVLINDDQTVSGNSPDVQVFTCQAVCTGGSKFPGLLPGCTSP